MACRQCKETRAAECNKPDRADVTLPKIAGIWMAAAVVSTAARRFGEPRICGVCGSLFCPPNEQQKGWG